MKNIIFDFDGVIFDSTLIKQQGFSQAVKDFGKEAQETLVAYHAEHGGVSRYAKFEWFLTTVLKQEATQENIEKYAQKFADSIAMSMQDPTHLIQEVVQFICENHTKYDFHIASGADQKELQAICKQHTLDKRFLSICGSPTVKTELVNNIMLDYGYAKDETCLIGDSYIDWEAANANQIHFFGYNNDSLRELGTAYIETNNFNAFWQNYS